MSLQGCDGSVLIDTTEQNIAEKEAPPNLTLRGFEVIDAIKAELEKECQGIVSCADILAMATRDGCAFAGGSAYDLKTGRRDGTISKMSEVNMPGPSFSVSDALANFEAKGLGLDDLITLLGGHSMGFAHCGFFLDRLYNFQGTGQPDPTISPNTLQTLLNACPQSLESNTDVSLDPKVFVNQNTSTPFKLDSSFYQAVLAAEAVFQLDQSLAFGNSTLTTVNDYVAKPKTFRKKFAQAMIKLTEVQVKTGQEGEIRINCRVVNPAGSPAPSPN
ncbi:hypothetical protein Vadar_024699 [Vaccinium darrowii]|uniref:Uncharacterized protein n=1 Tax=Vaccinium darrowii TaxID=229202 RepID=A0ACB7XC85_9ERIC|nr:hypothetical protein Vadar_024699 [Vaccinium darrowii]